MSCPLCRDPDCLYWQLRQTQTWHPPPAQLHHDDQLPAGYLRAIWRLRPERPGIATLGLDPREACFVLANGCTLDGIRYEASLKGSDGRVQLDGRVFVRIEPVALSELAFVDSGRAAVDGE